MTWLGHWQAWWLLVIVWIVLGGLMGLLLGAIARVGAWREGRGGK